ncbi:alpha/beta hydrolase [Actinospica sp. MGRD01-02]|uniref:Alpha/beta hydrolase n=1 Tax=Actinospica acidithermotolerans TaxID=2828514 RepID=A0A941E8V1_9ACTN|nr:alpha/beta hydrolase [Actinospica acidithermotolerans]MBR7826682.1 alpha/beta hydrolase [Actinospica acidithermotolerans]
MTTTTRRVLPHRVEFGGPADGPRVVLVHGLGGSHANWAALGPLLAESTRPVAVDLAGFGYTPGTGKTARVAANARLLERFLREEVGEPAVLVGNSMGGMISIMTAAAHPELVTGVVLLDPVLPTSPGARLDPAAIVGIVIALLPVLGPRVLVRRRAAAGARERALSTLSVCYGDISRLTDEQLDAEVGLTEFAEAEGLTPVAAYVGAARSLVLHGVRPRYRREMAAISAPVLLLHGTHDRLVSVSAADTAARKHPSWRYRRQDGGHVPHMELPVETARTITAWLQGKDA